MSEQALLEFNPVSPVARNSDPATSHAAARQVTKDGTRKRQAQEVLALVERFPGRTSAELAAIPIADLIARGAVGFSGLDRYQIARRLSELADPANGGLVERGEARKCNVTGMRALTWRVREGGGQ